MASCVICRFETRLDDIAICCAAGRCVCLRCYLRVTETERPMPEALRRMVIAALAATDVM